MRLQYTRAVISRNTYRETKGFRHSIYNKPHFLISWFWEPVTTYFAGEGDEKVKLNDTFEPSSGSNKIVGYLLTFASLLLVICTFPLSLVFVIKVGLISSTPPLYLPSPYPTPIPIRIDGL